MRETTKDNVLVRLLIQKVWEDNVSKVFVDIQKIKEEMNSRGILRSGITVDRASQIWVESVASYTKQVLSIYLTECDRIEQEELERFVLTEFEKMCQESIVQIRQLTEMVGVSDSNVHFLRLSKLKIYMQREILISHRRMNPVPNFLSKHLTSMVGETKRVKKKLQVFVSSTYKDLLEERQAAVEAILSAGHIPAGMELFKAGSESQLQTIKRWIDESDIYMLILGGRYGSIGPTPGRSYTHEEYEYALHEKKMPLFAVVISDEAIEQKVHKLGSSVMEREHPQEYKAFRELVLSKTSKFYNDLKDIKLVVHESLNELQNLYEFSGWVSGKDIPDTRSLEEKVQRLTLENTKLNELLGNQIKRVPKIGADVNDNKPIKLNYDGDLDYAPMQYINKINWEDVPDRLHAYVTEDAVHNYNDSIPSIAEVDEYNNEMYTYKKKTTTALNFLVVVYNEGSSKANEIYIKMHFPENVAVMEQTDFRNLKPPRQLDIPKDPVSEAEEKLSLQQRGMVAPFKAMDQLKSAFDNLTRLQHFVDPELFVSPSQRNWSAFVLDNDVIIKVKSLMHTMQISLENKFVLIPLSKGSSEVKISIMCAEYTEREFMSIPLEVV